MRSGFFFFNSAAIEEVLSTVKMQDELAVAKVFLNNTSLVLVRGNLLNTGTGCSVHDEDFDK